MDIIKCKEEEIRLLKEKYKLKLWWDGANCNKIIINSEIVALIECSEAVYPNCIHIDNLEVFNKGKGTGTKIVQEILKDVNFDVCLYVNDNKSREFWQKNGFKEINDGTGTVIHYYSHK